MRRFGTAPILRDMNCIHRVLFAAAVGVTIGCSDSPTGPVSPLFTRYVALGNSITAGFQSGGISDATQRASYPALIARQARARYSYASLGAGCPAPIDDLFDAISTGTIDPTCAVAGRTPGRRLLNNVAVPGADSFDPIAPVPSTDALTTLILDGRNQVDKALEATPTFVSIWIGNNDVLAAAITGQLGGGNGPTPQATFAANYAAMVNRLVAGGARDGVLIGVSDVTLIPLLVPASAFADPGLRLGLNLITGRTVTIDAGCTGSPSYISLAIIPEISSGAHPATIACGTSGSSLGDRFVLDATERAALVAAVAGYNTYISAKADSVGFAWYDPNPLFIAARARGDVPVTPNIANLDQPFGPLMSNDGVHPSSRGHVLIANELIALIAARYSVRLTPVR